MHGSNKKLLNLGIQVFVETTSTLIFRPAKKSRREEEQIINTNYALLHLFNKALGLLEDIEQKDITNIEKYLHKTVGIDLVNSIFALTSDSAEKNLTQVI